MLADSARVSRPHVRGPASCGPAGSGGDACTLLLEWLLWSTPGFPAFALVTLRWDLGEASSGIAGHFYLPFIYLWTLLLTFYSFDQGTCSQHQLNTYCAQVFWVMKVQSLTNTGAGNVKKGQKEQQGMLSVHQALGSIPAHPFPERKRKQGSFCLCGLYILVETGKESVSSAKKTKESIKETDGRTRGKWLWLSLIFCICKVRWFYPHRKVAWTLVRPLLAHSHCDQCCRQCYSGAYSPWAHIACSLFPQSWHIL